MLLTTLVLYFLPHQHNNHRAKLLSPILIAVTILMFIATQIGLSFLPRFTPVVLGYVSSISPEDVIDLTNNEREKAGLTRLQSDPLLTEAAIEKAAYMFANNYWAHTAPDGTEPWKFVTESGYKYRFAGENLARDFATPEAAIAAWLESPTHKDNLMSARYQDIGVAVVRGELNGVQTTLVVQFFGTKMSNAIAAGENPPPKPAQVSPPTSEPIVENIGGIAEEQKPLVVSPFATNRNLAITLVSLFLLVISIDMIIINRNKIVRSSSRSFAHFVFFGMIMLAVIISKAGNIL